MSYLINRTSCNSFQLR